MENETAVMQQNNTSEDPNNEVKTSSYKGASRLIKLTGWLTIVIAIYKIAFDTRILLQNLHNLPLGVYDLINPVELSITTIVYAVSLIYIILGKRILNTTDHNLQINIRILLVASLVIGVYELMRSNGFGLLLIGLLVFLSISDFAVRKLKKNDTYKSLSRIVNYRMGVKSWILFAIIVAVLVLTSQLFQSQTIPLAEWRKYENTKWGFELSYPPAYFLVDEDQDINGIKHFIDPRQPFEKSGYLSKLVEITNVVSTTSKDTSTPRGYFQMLLIPGNEIKSQEQLYTQIKGIVASSSAYRGEGSTDMNFEDTRAGNQIFPSINYRLGTSTTNNRLKSIFIYSPFINSSSTAQRQMIYRVDYSPADSPLFEKVIASLELFQPDTHDSQLSRLPYINEEYGVLMYPPEGWYAKRDDYFGAQIMFLDRLQGSISDFSNQNVIITLSIYPNDNGALSANAYINEIKKDMKDTIQLTKSVSGSSSDDFAQANSRYEKFVAASSRKEPITVDGISGITFDYGSYFGGSGFGKTIILEKNNKTYVVIAETGDENTLIQNKGKIIESMMSFKLIK